MHTIPAHNDLSILIPAAGTGERLGQGPKALLELSGKPLITWVTQKALKLSSDVIVTTPPNLLDQFSELCPDCRCFPGGATRQESVFLLLKEAIRDWVLIADVARPFVSLNLYNRVLASAKKSGVAGAFLAPDIPIARISNRRVTETFKRTEIGIYQLPHAFSRSLLLDTYKLADLNHWEEQSTLELAIRANHEVIAVPGEKTNIKLTTREDWQLAQLLTEYLK